MEGFGMTASGIVGLIMIGVGLGLALHLTSRSSISGEENDYD